MAGGGALLHFIVSFFLASWGVLNAGKFHQVSDFFFSGFYF
jgi:hypothetical protein